MHNFELSIYNEDVDYSGVVYHANYLKFFERARLEWFDALGFSLEKQKQAGYLYTIKKIELTYQKPARLGDRLRIHTRAEVIGRAKVQLHFHQTIDNLTQNQMEITQADLWVVCISENIKPKSLPESIVEKINV